MNIKTGYFIPEFPGQTHIFFWREKKALKKNGVDVTLISTRRPLSKIISHSWSDSAIDETTYLFPPGPGEIFTSLIALLLAGPAAWRRCLGTIVRSETKGLKGYLKYFGLLLMGARLSWIAEKNGIKHVHVHSCADAANIALFAKQISDLQYSMTLHGSFYGYGENQKQKWKHAAFCIVITKRLLKEVSDILKNNMPDSVYIAPMGVELEVFKRKSAYIPWDGRNTCNIFCCSRLTRHKGYGELIKSVHLLKKQGIDAKLRIAGEDFSKDGSERKFIEDRIDELSLGQSITLLGSISEEEVIAELESAHLFVLPSWNEELGVATMEAMAMKVPVVVTNVGGVPELVSNGIDGVMVPPKNTDQLTEGILSIIKNPAFAKNLSETGYNKIKSSFHSGISAQAISGYLKGDK